MLTALEMLPTIIFIIPTAFKVLSTIVFIIPRALEVLPTIVFIISKSVGGLLKTLGDLMYRFGSLQK